MSKMRHRGLPVPLLLHPGESLTYLEPSTHNPRKAQVGGRNSLKKISWHDVASRVVAASVGGYAMTYAVTICVTVLLPLSRTEAVLSAAMMSFLFYVGAIIWAFAAATPMRAWLGLLLSAGVSGLIAFPLVMAMSR
ncbi:conserved membrane protein of unknown function [Nitrospira japonica]|uniref:Iron uptake protein n=1 Tax=Nitrospira japonica TaxID=1325564 RepID=A0A1W1IB31_9BACT|nr:conserved membrane protein of unknown function [Nitrospira japonica]